MKDFPSILYRSAPDCVTCAYGDGIAILDLRSNQYFSLNAVGARIWDSLSRGATVADLVAMICGTYGVAPQVCTPDIERLMADLAHRGLVEAE